MILCLPCLALLMYFAIAGIFFPKYRSYVKEGWRCFVDKLLGKKCSVSFDNRMRLALSSWFTSHGMERAGRFFYNERNFNITLTLIVILSTIISIYLFFIFMNFMASPPCSETTCGI